MKKETTRIGQAVRACALGVTYLMVVIVAGHGLGPIGLLLVFGRAPEYVIPMASGWLGLVALILTVVLPAQLWRWIGIAAVILLVSSWASFLMVSEWKFVTIATSIPMFASVAWGVRSISLDAAGSEV